MESDKFCLRWNDFEKNMSFAFRELREDKHFFDVTLACDDKQTIQAHKVILSACSQFFRNILGQNPHQHPLLYLRGVKYSELQSVLNFMYHGEVNIAQEELNSFLFVAEDLRIKGLTQKQPEPQRTAPTRTIYEHQKQNRKPNIISNSKVSESPNIHNDDDIQEVAPTVCIKEEPSDLHPAHNSTTGHVALLPLDTPINKAQDTHTNMAQDTHTNNMAQEQENYHNFQEYDEIQHFVDPVNGYDNGANRTGREEEFENFLKQNSGQLDGGTWSCYLCGKITSGSGNMRQHFEAYHFHLGGVQCEVCSKTFKTKHSLATHVSKVHRNKSC